MKLIKLECKKDFSKDNIQFERGQFYIAQIINGKGGNKLKIYKRTDKHIIARGQQYIEDKFNFNTLLLADTAKERNKFIRHIERVGA